MSVLCVASEVSFSMVCGVVWCVLVWCDVCLWCGVCVWCMWVVCFSVVWCEKESIVCLYPPFLYVKLPVSNDKWSHDLSNMLQYLYEVQ